jgi:hypothetical protein
MSRFVVKIKKATRLDLQAVSLTIGTHSSCDLVLADPVAAQRHCRIAFRGDRYRIEDLGTSTGTFVNGLPAGESSLSDGDEIVVGVSRLTTSIVEEGPTLTLQLQPNSFHFVKSRSGEYHSDPDRWVRTEVGLGRFRPVRWANWLAILSLFVLLPLAFVEQEQLLEPGTFSTAHAELFSGNGSNPMVSADQRLVAQQQCSTCHEPLRGAPMERCDQCHSQLMDSQHPFTHKHRSDPDAQLVTGPWDDNDCNLCHIEHRGNSEFIPNPEVVARSCVRCHGGTVYEGGSVPPGPPEAVAFDRIGGYSSIEFGHDDHVRIDCAACHVGESETGTRDYAEVPFETCATCHVADQRDPTTEVSLLPSVLNTWTVGWHGSEAGAETCGQCHDRGAVFGPELMQVARYDVPGADYLRGRARYEVRARSHREFLVEHTGGQDCSECHKNERVIFAEQPRVGVFWHALHLAQGLPFPETAAAERELSADCLQCHTSRRESVGLTAASGVFQLSNNSCSRCHGETPDQGEPPRPVPPDPQALGELTMRSDFPHRFHLDFTAEPLAQGCFTCHDFDVGEGSDPYMAVPITKAEARSCATCHGGHENIAGNACTKCHSNPTGTYNVFLGSRPPADRPLLTRPWPTGGTFSHTSPGHAGSVSRDCNTCHQDLVNSENLRVVPIPTLADPACTDCHGFHWRRYD